VKGATAETIRLIGGTLCLDFANTVEWAGPGEPLAGGFDVFDGPGALAAWGRRMSILDSRTSSGGSGELDLALALRLTIHKTFSSVAANGTPEDRVLESLRSTYAEAVGRARLGQREQAWPLRWPADQLRSVRHAVAADSINLLADPEQLARLGQCPGRNCGGLFIDRTGGRRRWCSMEACGSREKARRFYERQRPTNHRRS
jgi:predicted RNA-binding Zn ribbon-like protein